MKLLVVPIVNNCDLLTNYILVSNEKSCWWSLLPLINLTNSSSLQNVNSQIRQMIVFSI